MAKQPVKSVIHKIEEEPEMTQAMIVSPEFVVPEDAGAGFEDVTQADLALPLFRILQKLSKELDQSEPDYIEAAREGWWLDTTTKKLYVSLLVVPCKFVTHWIEWKTRKAGGGLVQNWGADNSRMYVSTRDDSGRLITPEGTELIETPTWFCYVLAGFDAIEKKMTAIGNPGLFTFPLTQQKVSKQWLTSARALKEFSPDGRHAYTPALYSMVYKIGAMPTKNDSGSWMLATVTRVGKVADGVEGVDPAVLLPVCREVYKDATEMLTKSVAVITHAAESQRQSGSARNVVDDDIPF
jgi:hypothetical protein